MPNPYNPAEAEAKWRKRWEEEGAYNVNLKKAKKPYYGLVMFPYPSGDKLHVGHWYNYAPADSYFRYQRMLGNDVFTPMGFDAFGLPAENYAIKTGVHPDESITKNVATMVEQLKRLGCMYDWGKMVNTSKPEYYKWTQWLFLQMFQNNLAYKKEALVNWCPKDVTVLANEQVKEGKCDRCGTEVIQKPLAQWFWKITQYADRLLDGLEKLEWPEKTKLMQKNWIGRSEGAEVEFGIKGRSETITVFTTRPDTLFGVTYMVLAPEHPLVDVITIQERRIAIQKYIHETRKKTDLQRSADITKTGEFTGAYAINPVNGEEVQIWVADYVLMHYGTGSVMAVPAHDERDFDFASYHQLPIKCIIDPDMGVVNFSFYVHPKYAVIVPKGNSTEEVQHQWDQDCRNHVLSNQKCWTGPGRMIDSGLLTGLSNEEAKRKIVEWLEEQGKGRKQIQYRLKDWLVSRQRYWGAPIPIVYDPEGKPHPVPEKHLPWLLPTDVEFKPTGKSPLTDSKEFIERTEKLFGKGWTPEFDTMDTFVCSSFYYLRYLMEGDRKKFVDKKLEGMWMPVSMYIGGPEHATMHLIYARFVMMALHDFGMVTHEEPFRRLVHQGLITNQGAKMSKSKGNVVSPDGFVDRHGADVFRMYLMFMGPFTDGGDWSDSGIKGIDRFVQRAWTIFTEKSGNDATESAAFQSLLHKTIKRVTDSVSTFHFNTAISALMEFLNAAEAAGQVSTETAMTFARLIAPLAPHLAEELWETLGGPHSAKASRGKKGFVIDQDWPSFDPAQLVSDTMTIVVQVNGKLRANIEVPRDTAETEVLAKAKEEENVKKFLTGPLKKEVYVKGRLVNLVV
ncbi:MAG: leucine--tRNA ligase [Candidatus Peribacteraceae bacterium]